MLNTLEARLVDVNLALQKISDGNYGKCEVSGEIEGRPAHGKPSCADIQKLT